MKKLYYSIKAFAALLGAISLVNFFGFNSDPSLWGTSGHLPVILMFGVSTVSLLMCWLKIKARKYKFPYVATVVVLAVFLYVRLNTITDRELDVTYKGLYLLVFNRAHVYYMFSGPTAWVDYTLLGLTAAMCVIRVLLKTMRRFQPEVQMNQKQA